MTTVEFTYIQGSGLKWFSDDMKMYQQLLNEQNIKYSFRYITQPKPIRACFDFENSSDAIMFKLRYMKC